MNRPKKLRRFDRKNSSQGKFSTGWSKQDNVRFLQFCLTFFLIFQRFFRAWRMLNIHFNKNTFQDASNFIFTLQDQIKPLENPKFHIQISIKSIYLSEIDSSLSSMKNSHSKHFCWLFLIVFKQDALVLGSSSKRCSVSHFYVPTTSALVLAFDRSAVAHDKSPIELST